MMTKNIIELFEQQVREQGANEALVDFIKEKGRATSFTKLANLSNLCAQNLQDLGVRKATRVVMAIRPSLEFVVYTLAVLRLGAVAVFIDSGMKKRNIFRCINQVSPCVFLGGKIFQILSRIFCKTKPQIRIMPTQINLDGTFNKNICQEVAQDELAAIIFTSGSTGTAKGVEYTHSIFSNQISIIKKIYGVSSLDRDLSIFPLFSLLSIMMGMPSVIPKVDMAHPAKISCKKIYDLINLQKITFSFGSPTFWSNMAKFCEKRKASLPSLRAVVMAGCSVPSSLHLQLFNKVLSKKAVTFVPYGATEALPITSFTGIEVLSDTEKLTNAGYGTCVGKKSDSSFDIKIIKISDKVIAKWDKSLELPLGEIGEICVKGPTITHRYFQNEQATEQSKIFEGKAIWHRMGDVGYFDEQARLWFCGRKADRISHYEKELYTDQVENIFNCLLGIKQVALVKTNNKKLVLFVQLKKRIYRWRVLKDIYTRASKHKLIFDRVIFKRKFPVDVRHNAKIKRDILRTVKL